MADYLTIAEFKSYASILSVDGVDDVVITNLITAASRYIDKFTNRRFYASTETHYIDVPRNGNDRRMLYLDDDCLSVTTLTNGNTTVITSTYYHLLPLNSSPKYAIRLKDSSTYNWEPTSAGDRIGAITVAGSWGYCSTTPGDIKQACYEMALAAYRRRSTIGSGQMGGAILPSGVIVQPEDVSKTVMQILRGYVRAF